MPSACPRPISGDAKCLSTSIGRRLDQDMEVSQPGPVHLGLADGTINGSGKVVNVPRIEAGHGDTAVLGHVDVVLLAEPEHLCLGEAREGEHANLVSDVVPGSGRPQLLELGAKGLAHADDAARHVAQVVLPLCKELGVVQHDGRDGRTVARRVADLGALQDGKLAGDARGRVGRVGRRHEVEAARTLAVQAKVLRKALRHQQLKALGDEVTDGLCIPGEVAGREALVGAVKEGEVALCTTELGKLGPLVRRRVNARWVVGAGVQEYDGAVRRRLQGCLHALKVEPLCILVEIGVGRDGQAHVGEDLVVVCPGRRRQVDGPVTLIELGQEEGAEMHGTGARDGLDRRHALLGQRRRVGAQDQLRCLACEARQPRDWQILMVQVRIIPENLIGLLGVSRASSRDERSEHGASRDGSPSTGCRNSSHCGAVSHGDGSSKHWPP